MLPAERKAAEVSNTPRSAKHLWNRTSQSVDTPIKADSCCEDDNHAAAEAALPQVF